MRTRPVRAASAAFMLASLLALAGALAGAASPASDAQSAHNPGLAHRGRVHTVIIDQLRYVPAELVVHRGDRIVWINKDLIPHTVTADGRAFDSGTIAAGSEWSYRARRPGRYSYACRFHPSMKGKLIVE